MSLEEHKKVKFVVDLTCEVDSIEFENIETYLNLPTWDACPPKLNHIVEATKKLKIWFEQNQNTENIALIHCAYG